ncbi:MAG: sodium:proton antiporter NhaD [Fibrobacteraceae bacterium]
MVMALFPVMFVLGYMMIALEHPLKINKSASALVLGSVLWLLWFIVTKNAPATTVQLNETIGSVASIIFFLMGAMAIVTVVDSYDGFSIITSRVRTNNVRVLLWLITGITFFMSAVLDNMTTAIVMMMLTRKLISDSKARLYFGGMIIIASNAGGAASPIGDVTTTMLWIGGQISALGILERVNLASILDVLVPLLFVSRILKGTVRSEAAQCELEKQPISRCDRDIVFFSGIGGLVLVPVYRAVFGIPPYLGMFFSLGLLWFLTDIILKKRERQGETNMEGLSISHLLSKVDFSSVLFFAGILFAVGVFSANGQLSELATWLGDKLGSIKIIVFITGLLSSVVDNVPLVAAMIGMYPIASYPMDSLLWEFAAYCAGTGGSILIIGSAAGVAAMGIGKISFGWYLKHIAPLALLGYAVGAACYLGMRLIF